MAFLGVSDDFDLDDHGILRDSTSSAGGFLIDDEGIVRDDLDIYKHHGSHWSDSGFDGGKLSNASTLRQLQTSFDDDSRLLDQSVNISEFEASKDDLSFEQPSVSGSFDFLNRGDTPQNLLDTGNSFDRSTDFGQNQGNHKPLLDNVNLIERSGDFNETDTPWKKPRRGSHQKDLFSEEYYSQLRDLGVLIDDGDLSDVKDSVGEFEQEEAYCSREDINYEEQDPLDNISDFLQKDNERPDTISEFFRYETTRTQNDSAALPGDFFQQTGYTGRPTSPGSQTTVSNKSFPEVSPEEALLLYQRNRNAQFIDHAAEVAFGDQQLEIDPEGVFHISSDNPAILERTGDDDEIFLITGGIVPSRNTSSVQSGTPGTPFSNQSSRRSSLGSIQFETYARDGHNVPRDGHNVPRDSQNFPRVGQNFSRDSQTYARDGQNFPRDGQVDKSPAGKNSVSLSKELPRPDSTSHSRPPSSASYLSTTSDNQSRPNTARSDSSKKLSKAKSQESFFEHSKNPRSEKGPKRLLPTPAAAADENQSYKLKSKSTTNISGQSGPVKPTHMSISQITRMTMEEGADGMADGDKPPGEMTVRLKQEFQKRKQATELVQQLQKDYDSLLSKYALAELTIDQMRLGAKITLHSDSPKPGQATMGMMSPAQHQQVIQISGANRAIFSSSPPSQAKSVSTYSSPLPESVDLHDSHVPSGTPLLNDSWSTNRTDRGSHLESRTPSIILETEDKVITPKKVGAESVKTSLLHHAGNINERIESFGNILETRQLTLEDQEKVFEQLRTDHEKLRRNYLQAKEDYNVLRRSGASITDANFDQNKQLEGELFRLGMRFDEIHEKVDKNVKEMSTKRQPFQANRLAEDQQDLSHDEDESAIDQSKQLMHRTLAGSDLVQPMEDSEFEQKIQMLHDEYNALMDRYRRLKQMAQTPERDKEIDNLVKKLKEICNEAPDIFRLPPELEERWDKMQKREATRGRSPLLESQTDGANRDNKQARTDKEEMRTDFEKHSSGQGENARRVLNTSGSSRSGLVSPRGRLSPGDKINPLPSRYSPSPSSRFSPRDRGPGGRNSPHSDRDSVRSGCDSRQGYDSPSDSESYDSKVPRPRRRDHQFQDHKMKKRSDGGSMTSLPEGSTMSDDHDSRTLANLPGPGKFKQMTKQRAADDADSGFIGSVVGSDVSHLTSPLKQQQQQQLQQQQRQEPQQPVRLRNTGNAGNERTSSDQNIATGNLGKTGPVKSKTLPNDERPSSRNDVIRGLQKTDAYTEADSMDVSFYDDVTESDLSELEEKSQGRKEERRSERRMDSEDTSKTLEDSGRESDDTPRPVQRLKLTSNKKAPTQQTPLKPNRRSRVKSSDDEGELTPRATTIREIPRQRRRYSSEDADVDSPRSANVDAPRSARIQETRTITTKVAESRITPRLNEELHSRTEVRSEVRSELRPENLRQLENRGVGSDLGWDAKGTDSDVTRASSVASSRLRALQVEVEKLKEKMQQVRETPAPPAPAPSQPQQPEYYDPFDDPYGFMRMPRRRANSFSGSPVREWDEWYWTLPLQRQNEGHDIPLGYAAADAYAELPPPPAAQPPLAQPSLQPSGRSRVRRRRAARETSQGPVSATVEQNGYTSDPPNSGTNPRVAPLHTRTNPRVAPPHTRTNPRVAPPPIPATAAAAEQENVGLYEYYVPRSRYSTRDMRQQLANRGFFQTPSGAKIFASPQPGVTGTTQPVYRTPQTQFFPNRLAGTPSNMYQPAAAAGPIGSQPQPFYNIRRSEPRGFSQQRPLRMQPSAYVYDDVEVVSHSPDFHPGAVPSYPTVGQPLMEEYVVGSDLCPNCGVGSYHVHDDYDAAGVVSDQTQYVYRRGRPRRRSRSLSRSRYYSPDETFQKYLVKEITQDSSADTDVEIQHTRRRSRSLSRSRRKGRRYRKEHRDGYHSEREVRRDDIEDSDLNASLNYSMDISRLTKKMIKTVKNELHKSGVKREFGSSYW